MRVFDRSLEILLFTVDGRVSRTTFWIANSPYIVLTVAMIYLAGERKDSLIGSPFFVFYIIFLVCWMIPCLCLMVKRLHDGGYSWKGLLWGMIPFFGYLVLLGLYFGKGEGGKNKYGDQMSGEGFVQQATESHKN